MHSALWPLLIALQTGFTLVDREDPITQERQLAYIAASGDSALAIGCSRAGSSREIFIRLLPERYHGPGPNALLWQPNAVYRFENGQPNNTEWYFDRNFLELGGIFGNNRAKAEFINALAQNRVLHVRYEATMGDVRTVTFNYAADLTELSQLIRTCNPRRVQQHLREIGSSIVTNPR